MLLYPDPEHGPRYTPRQHFLTRFSVKEPSIVPYALHFSTVAGQHTGVFMVLLGVRIQCRHESVYGDRRGCQGTLG